MFFAVVVLYQIPYRIVADLPHPPRTGANTALPAVDNWVLVGLWSWSCCWCSGSVHLLTRTCGEAQ